MAVSDDGDVTVSYRVGAARRRRRWPRSSPLPPSSSASSEPSSTTPTTWQISDRRYLSETSMALLNRPAILAPLPRSTAAADIENPVEKALPSGAHPPPRRRWAHELRTREGAVVRRRCSSRRDRIGPSHVARGGTMAASAQTRRSARAGQCARHCKVGPFLIARRLRVRAALLIGLFSSASNPSRLSTLANLIVTTSGPDAS